MRNGFFLLIYLLVSNLIIPNSYAKYSINDLPALEAEKYNSLPAHIQAEVRRRLEQIGNYDPERMHLDNTGHFYIVDDSLEKIMADYGMNMPVEVPSPKNVIFDVPPSGFTAEGVPIFHSLPGNPNVIYLNFVGQNITSTAWNDSYGVSVFLAQRYVPAAYNPNGTPGFPPAVQQAIAAIWKRVAEDYAPWQVDVTTQSPATYTNTTLVALITNSTTSDGRPMPNSAAGGVAYLDTFNFFNAAYYRPALIYYNNLGGGREDFVAEVVSHEIGHNLGLSHEGVIGGTPYFPGGGTGEISWGCIMGAAYFQNLVKFCNGDYLNANNKEDQVAIISSQLPLRARSAGNSIATATPLPQTNGTFRFSGIIENYTTSNFFSLANAGGTISINANPYRSAAYTLGNNLCIGLRLYNSAGTVIATSNNPQSCSANLTANSLPFGTYYIQLYPVDKPAAPFSVYGIMGQYDLAGSFTSGSTTLTLKPQYTTLALNSFMSFDANDTLRVSGGTPPYTFKAMLNSFSRSGSTFTYNATKPGLDTLTVTDARGNISSTRVTISLVDFGGMYGYSWATSFPNPITGTFGCPAGYTNTLIIGTFNLDYPLYFCYRLHTNGVPANYDFGGIFSGSGSGPKLNPVTGASRCPSGYNAAQVFGENTHRVDYPVYFCYKTHNETVQEATSFAGMYGLGGSQNYPNPITGALSCPTGTLRTTMLDTPSVDYPFYFCSFPSTPLTIAPQYTNLTLNNTMFFTTTDNVRVTGGTPPYSYSAVLNNFSRSANIYTYTASKVGLDTITVTDSKGATASAKVTVGYMDFGGMYGFGENRTFNNPITGTLNCPTGYTSRMVMGTPNFDFPLSYCYRLHARGIPANYDFGGMYSNSGPSLKVNPMTGAASCPVNYIATQVYGTDNHIPDYPAFMCYKSHDESIAEAAHFGGMYAPAGTTNYTNPVTGALSCPSGWTNAQMLGTSGFDYPLYFCY